MRREIRAGLGAAAIAAGAFAAFGPAFRGGWLWDDPILISQNPVLRDPGGLAKIWSGRGGPDYFPLTGSVQWAEWHLWGGDVLGYHLASAALHILSALLLWRLFARLGARAAFAGALFFAVHPLAVESVAWMSELKNTLSLPLALLAVLAYARWIDRPEGRGRAGAYVLALGLFVLATLAKSSVAMLPCVLLLLAWWRRGRLRRRDVAAAAPFFAVALALAIVTIRFQNARAIGPEEIPAASLPARLAAAGWGVWFYLGKCAWPAGLLPIYPKWALEPAWLWIVPPWAALAVVFGWAWRRRRGWGKHVLFGLGSFVLDLAPVLGLVPMAFQRLSWVSDHFAYLSLASAAGLVAAAAGPLWESRPRAAKAALASAGAAIALLLVAESRGYAGVFRSEEALWTYTVSRNPAAWLAYNNLGILDAKAGRLGRAIAEGETAVRLDPGRAESRNNLGLSLEKAGRLPAAIAQLREALRLDPSLPGAYVNLGRALFDQGRYEEAIAQFGEALRLDPGAAEARGDLRAAHNNLGNALARAGRLEEAVAQFRLAVAADPSNPGVRLNLARALHALGRDAEAEAEWQAAMRLEGGG